MMFHSGIDDFNMFVLGDFPIAFFFSDTKHSKQICIYVIRYCFLQPQVHKRKPRETAAP